MMPFSVFGSNFITEKLKTWLIFLNKKIILPYIYKKIIIKI